MKKKFLFCPQKNFNLLEMSLNEWEKKSQMLFLENE